MATPTKLLTDDQHIALRKLAADPAHPTEAGTLGMLRRRGYVGRQVGKDAFGHQKTTSPILPAGNAYLASHSLWRRP